MRSSKTRRYRRRVRCETKRYGPEALHNEGVLSSWWQPTGVCHGLTYLYNLVTYQCRAKHAGQCGVEMEGGTIPTKDWFLNLQILTSGGLQ